MDKRDDELFGFDAEGEDEAPEIEEELTIDSLDDEEGEAKAASGRGDDFGFDFAEAEPNTASVGDEEPLDVTFSGDQPEAPPSASSATPVLTALQGDEEGEPLEALLQEQEEHEAKRSPSRLLLLLLLAVAAAAVFFLVDRGGEQAPAPASVASKKLPIKPPPAAKEKPVTEVVERRPVAVAGEERLTANASAAKTVAPTAADAGKAGSEREAAVASLPEKSAAAAQPEAAESPAKPATEVKTVAEQAATAAAEQKPVAPPAAGTSSGQQEQPAGGALSAGYRVRVGAFILPANLRDALATVKKLGYEPRVEAGKITRSMVRLRYGVYPRQEARRHLDELKKIAPGAFVVYEQEKGAVYAGSFVNVDKARRYADVLWEKKGIRLDEVKVDVQVPLKKVSIGPFSDRAAARKAAAAMRQAGLEGEIVAP
ncbi:cell division septation protein DedD [Geothermobacter ehrlichii]|uniref:Cell division septation protein DedD n=1 Tax=Geothermobacter ehrlichii TaxID=213224 RepID=A0A5D3WMP1_9BACT|nr:SPOR domain-containing protein [Geothermobacter ehrlichii]TYO99867.1 cell division septation protein DedD [Geothermobacter ehrlichii]